MHRVVASRRLRRTRCETELIFNEPTDLATALLRALRMDRLAASSSPEANNGRVMILSETYIFTLIRCRPSAQPYEPHRESEHPIRIIATGKTIYMSLWRLMLFNSAPARLSLRPSSPAVPLLRRVALIRAQMLRVFLSKSERFRNASEPLSVL